MLSPSSARGPAMTVVTLSLDASCRTLLACTPCRISLLYSAVRILRRQSCHTHVYVINCRERARGLALHQRVQPVPNTRHIHGPQRQLPMICLPDSSG